MIVRQHWKQEPDEHDYPAAHDFLSLVVTEPLATTLVGALKGAPLTRYSFLYTIPTRQLAFAIAPDGSRNGALEVDIAVYDADAKLVTGLSQIIKMPLSDTAYQRFILSPSRFFQLIDLPPGQLFVRIGVLDRTSNKVGTLEIPVTVAKK